MVISNVPGLDGIGSILAATTALSTASFGMLDSLKVVAGGPSNFGTAGLHRSLTPFAPALDAAIGAEAWWLIVRANWIAGVAKDDQKAKVQALIRIGLTSATAAAMAEAGHVDPVALQAAIGKPNGARI
ncbi:MAG: hypothetical protein JWN66_1664 [Sphingomonas bacterium]|uniref:hypothetical protein n=1 Tax=Sphingomonas bacterium TaxID=1895847 RepID=UPI0026022A93|nr:hypothetical protein [Sphingomonas bacterium]MDB5704548.1 hypothetical protein [Sphingomonas bacterium]